VRGRGATRPGWSFSLIKEARLADWGRRWKESRGSPPEQRGGGEGGTLSQSRRPKINFSRGRRGTAFGRGRGGGHAFWRDRGAVPALGGKKKTVLEQEKQGLKAVSKKLWEESGNCCDRGQGKKKDGAKLKPDEGGSTFCLIRRC